MVASFLLGNPPFIECLVDHQKSHAIAEIEKLRSGRVVTGPDGIAAHILQFPQLAFQGVPSQEIQKEAISQGMSTLYDDGIIKVLNGTTTIEEVFRVAKKVH